MMNASGQDTIAVARKYYNDPPSTEVDSLIFSVRNALYISLDEGFDDSLYITINDKPVMNKYCRTNESIGYADSFGIGFNDSSEIKTLRIKFTRTNRIIEEKLDLKYKSLQVRYLEEWTLIYSNHFPKRM